MSRNHYYCLFHLNLNKNRKKNPREYKDKWGWTQCFYSQFKLLSHRTETDLQCSKHFFKLSALNIKGWKPYQTYSKNNKHKSDDTVKYSCVFFCPPYLISNWCKIFFTWNFIVKTENIENMENKMIHQRKWVFLSF